MKNEDPLNISEMARKEEGGGSPQGSNRGGVKEDGEPHCKSGEHGRRSQLKVARISERRRGRLCVFMLHFVRDMTRTTLILVTGFWWFLGRGSAPLISGITTRRQAYASIPNLNPRSTPCPIPNCHRQCPNTLAPPNPPQRHPTTPESHTQSLSPPTRKRPICVP